MLRLARCLPLVLATACASAPASQPVHEHAAEWTFWTADLAAFAEDGAWVLSPLMDVPSGATRVGMMLDTLADHPDARIPARARGTDEMGRPGNWIPVTYTWHEPGFSVGRADLGMRAVAVEFALDAASAAHVPFITVNAVIPFERPSASLQRPATTVRAALSPALIAAGVKTRADWGARDTTCTQDDPVRTVIAVHHTATPVSEGAYEARLRQIQSYHMDTQTWCDIGYHFLVTSDGTRWEGREARYLGTHVANANDGNLGVSLVGCFQDTGCNTWTPFTPPQVMLDGLADMVGRLAYEYVLPVTTDTVKGHRDFPGAATACPGDNMVALMTDLRVSAENVRAGLAMPPDAGTATDAGTTSDAGTTPTDAQVQGVLWDSSVTAGPTDTGNVRVTSARVTCSCGQFADVRAGDAYWSFRVPPGMHTFTASAAGYQDAMRSLTVAAGDQAWASMGMAPVASTQRATLLVHVTAQATGASVSGAVVEALTIEQRVTDGSGNTTFTLDAGAYNFRVTHALYDPQTFSFTLAAAQNAQKNVALLPRTPVDAGQPRPDSGQPRPDAGQPRADAGQPRADAGTARDAGMTQAPDAGASTRNDGGRRIPNPTGNSSSSGGDDNGEDPSSCNCAAPVASSFPAAALVMMLAFLRIRRR